MATITGPGATRSPVPGPRRERWRAAGASILAGALGLTLLPALTPKAAAVLPYPTTEGQATRPVAPWPRPASIEVRPTEDTTVFDLRGLDPDIWPDNPYVTDPFFATQDEIASFNYLGVNGGDVSFCDGSEPLLPSYSLIKFTLPDVGTGPDDIPPGAVVSGVQLNLTSIESELRGHPRAYAYSVDPDFDSTTVEWADYSWEVFGAPPPGNLRGTDQLHLGVHRTMGTDPEITCSDGALQAFPRNGWGMSGELWSNSPIWQDSPAQTRDSASHLLLNSVREALNTPERELALQLWAQPGEDPVRFASSENAASGPRLKLSFATPELVGAVPINSGESIRVTGGVIGTPTTEYQFEVSGSDTCASLGAEPITPLARIPVTTDEDGTATISTDLPLGGATLPRFVTASLTISNDNPYWPFFTELSTPTECLPVGADNDIWPRALEVQPTPDGDTATATITDGYLDRPGTARWYKVPVTPEGRLQVDLTDLPADYDVALFGDIAKAYEHLIDLQDLDDLKRLSAQYAPSVFSPSVFSPSVFSPSVFSPEAFAPSVFSPSVFSPSVFSPSVFSPSVFSPSVFSPSVFSPSVFSPSVFSPSVFSPSEFVLDPDLPADITAEAFSGAQSRSILAVSATPGTVDESTAANTWAADSHFYIRVTGSNGAHDPVNPFTLTINRTDHPACIGVDPITGPESAAAASATTLVLHDSNRPLEGTAEDLAELTSTLATFVHHEAVDGVVADLADSPRIQALREQAEDHPDCVYATNLVAGAIKDLVDAHRVANPDLAYVVILGPDGSVPFFRYPDQALLGPESDFSPPVSDDSISQAALRLNYFLGQDEYGSADVIDVGAYRIPLPDLAVGRVVETAAEATGILDVFLAESVVEPRSSLVTGYDFLAETARSISADLHAGTDVAPTELITDNDVSPQDPASWTAAQLEEALYPETNDLVFLGGHFSANSALAADFETSIYSPDLADPEIAPADFTNTIVFSIGCHAGYNIDNADAIPDVTWELDWAQAFAQRGATLIAGTGYQYGDTDFMEYSERIYADFARELRYGTGAVPIGDALMAAKQNYLVQTPDPRGLHRKSLMQIAIFGLPMLAVDMPEGRLPRPVTTSAISSTTGFGANPGADLDLQSADLSLTPDLESHTVDLTGIGTPDVSATYLSNVKGGDPSENQLTPDVVANAYEPAIPLLGRDVTVDGKVLRGVGFRGGDYQDTDVVPLTGAPTSEIRGVHTAFSSPVFYPMRLATPNYTDALGSDGRTHLLVTPVQHKAAGGIQSTQRKYDSLDLRLFYSSALGRAAQAAAPSLSRVTAVVDGSDILFGATAMTDPAAGIQQVWVSYTGAPGATSSWASLDLTQCNLVNGLLPADCRGDASSSRWVGRLVGAAGSAEALQFMVQAVSGAGMVGMDDNLGSYHGVVQQPSESTPPAVGTVLALSGVPSSAPYGSTISVTASLTATGEPLAGRTITASLAGSSRVGVTDDSGIASFAMPVTAIPAATPVSLRVGFNGSGEYASSSASEVLTVTKAATSLELSLVESEPEAPVGVKARLTANDAPLPARSILLTLPDGSVQQFTTNYLGEATALGLPLPPGSTLTATFLGSAGPVGATEDPSYAEVTTTMDVAAIPPRNIGVYAGGPGCVVNLGNNVRVSGAVHSEGSLVVGNNATQIGGDPVTYVTSAAVKAAGWSPAQIAAGDAPGYPLEVDLAELAARADHVHTGNLSVGNNATLAPGLHFVNGNVSLGNKVRGTVTIVATGTIGIGGNADLTPHLDGLALVSAAGGDACGPVITVGNGSAVGVAFAPHGGISLGNNSQASALMGSGVSAGNNAQITGHLFP